MYTHINNFDWEFYINYYKDLRQHGINSKEKAMKHWLLKGTYEGRIINLSQLNKKSQNIYNEKQQSLNLFPSTNQKLRKYLEDLLKEGCSMYYEYLKSYSKKYINQINKNNKFKIFYFIDLEMFIQKMSRVRFWPIIELAKKEAIDLIFIGPGWPNFNKKISVQENILKLGVNYNFGIWYKPLSIIFNKKIKLPFPVCIRYNEMWDQKWTLEEITKTNSNLIVCHHLNEFNTYQKSKKHLKFVYIPHQTNHNIFNKNSSKRDIDILLSGRAKKKHYPLKHKLFTVINKYKNTLLKKYKIVNHNHPGYNNNDSYTDINQKKYAEILNRSKIAIACTSKYNYRLGKYVEIPMCGTIIFGDIPFEDRKNFENFVVEVTIDMSEETIIQKLIDTLENKKELQKKVDIGYKWSLQYTSDKYADKLLHHMQTFILNSRKIFIISDEIKNNHPEFKKQKWICDILKQQFLEYFPNNTTQDARKADTIWYLASWNHRYIPSGFSVNEWYVFLEKKKVVFTIHHIDEKKYRENQYDKTFLFMNTYGNTFHAICQKTYQFLTRINYDKKLVKEYLWIDNKDFFYINEKEKLRQKYKFSKKSYLVGSFQKDTEGASNAINPEPKLSKGPDIFIKIIEDILLKKPNLVVILTGLRREYLINHFKKRNIKYHYFNMVSIKEINELYNCLDLYIISSRYEGGPRSIFEAGVTRTPIISTDVGIAKEFMPKESIYDVDNFLSYRDAKTNVEKLYQNISALKIDRQIENIKNMLCE